MTISININDVIFNVRNISHLEVAGIPEIEAQYVTEAGTEKMEEIRRCFDNAEGLIRLQMDRFLSGVHREPDTGETEKFVYEFTPSVRSQQFREDIVRGCLSDALVNLTLSQFYTSVASKELAEQHNALAESALAKLERLYFDKKPPMIPED